MSHIRSELLRNSGIVEGFYGQPWTQAERLGAIRFAGSLGMGEYLYAPKGDPFHRERWEDLYPHAELHQLGELGSAASEVDVRFTYALSPGLSMRFSNEEDHRALAAKTEQLWGAGVTSFALLFDDVPMVLQAEDEGVFGAGEGAVGTAHGQTCARFLAWWRSMDTEAGLLMCPTDYAGCATSEYRRGLASTLPCDARVLWTGRDVVVGEVTRRDVDDAAASYQRPLVLWDNFPCNDFDRTRLFAGPLSGRLADVEGSALVGILSNPMVEAAPSRFALASVAQWAADPAGFAPVEGEASALVAGADAELILPLVQACSSWPPSARQDECVDELVRGALAGEERSRHTLERRLTALAGRSAEALAHDPRTDVVNALVPWLEAATSVAGAGMAACAILEAGGVHAAGDSLVYRAEVALRETDAHFHNVLRDAIPPFVRRVLGQYTHEPPVSDSRGVVWLVTREGYPEETHNWKRFLEALKFSVVVKLDLRDRHEADSPSLIVLGSRAKERGAESLRGSLTPVLAVSHHAVLGMGVEGGTTMNSAWLDVGDACSHMAGGLSGRVRVHRGPGRFTWTEPAAQATVIARESRGGAAVVTLHATGSQMVTGDTFVAAHAGLFLSTDGPAPWLLTAEGRRLCGAVIDCLVEGVTPVNRTNPLSSVQESDNMEM